MKCFYISLIVACGLALSLPRAQCSDLAQVAPLPAIDPIAPLSPASPSNTNAAVDPPEDVTLSPEVMEKIKKSIKVVDPEQFKRTFKKSKPNKVSSLLHYLHGLSNKSVYDPKQVEDVKAIIAQPNFQEMSDEEVLKSLCGQSWGSGVCEKAAQVAAQKKPQHVADIVQSIRNKPAYVNANKLLWHKLFEKAITKVEENDYDEKLNTVINTAAAKNPYLFAASKIIDRAV